MMFNLATRTCNDFVHRNEMYIIHHRRDRTKWPVHEKMREKLVRSSLRHTDPDTVYGGIYRQARELGGFWGQRLSDVIESCLQGAALTIVPVYIHYTQLPSSNSLASSLFSRWGKGNHNAIWAIILDFKLKRLPEGCKGAASSVSPLLNSRFSFFFPFSREGPARRLLASSSFFATFVVFYVLHFPFFFVFFFWLCFVLHMPPYCIEAPRGMHGSCF